MLKKMQEKQVQTEKRQRFRKDSADPPVEEAARASGSTTGARTELPTRVDGVTVNPSLPVPAPRSLKEKCSRLLSSAFQPTKWSWRGISFGLVNEDIAPATDGADTASPSINHAAGFTVPGRLKVTVEEVEDVSAEEPKEADNDTPLVAEPDWHPDIVSHIQISRDEAHLVCSMNFRVVHS